MAPDASEYDLPLEFFGIGDPEEVAQLQLLHREQVVLEQLVKRFAPARLPQSRDHFRGCAQRLQMMGHARVEILEASAPDQQSLNPQTLNRLNIFLNSFYLNLLGAADNLAWATTYELGLLPEVDESVEDTRRFCGLGKRRFIASLRIHSIGLGRLLDGVQEWLREVKEFRDPAAHSIPLAMAPGVMTPEEGERWVRTYNASIEALIAGDFDRHARLAGEAAAIGIFRPWLPSPKSTEPDEIYIVPALMAQDERRFLDLLHHFLLLLPITEPSV